MLANLFEVIMLICFGCSWPISVIKSIRSKSTKGKSIIFTFAILVGYIAGIASKIAGGIYTYVLWLYFVNLFFVSVDVVIYFINRKRENATTKETEKAIKNEKTNLKGEKVYG